jgi:hypothetical protein
MDLNRTVCSLIGGFTFLLLTMIVAAQGQAAPAPFQRMVLAPGCYVLAPGGFYDVSAFCLDEGVPAPAPGTRLGSVPDSLGDTFIKMSDQSVVGLQAALETHLIRMEGLGGQNYFRVRVKNLTGHKLEICINAPTVVMGDEGYPTADLKKTYAQLVRVLPRASDADHSKDQDSDNQDLETHLKLQKTIWDILEKSRDPEEKDLNNTENSSTSATSHKGSPSSKNCVGRSDSTMLCADK